MELICRHEAASNVVWAFACKIFTCDIVARHLEALPPSLPNSLPCFPRLGSFNVENCNFFLLINIIKKQTMYNREKSEGIETSNRREEERK